MVRLLDCMPWSDDPEANLHLGLVNAAVRLDLALRMRDEGIDEVPHVTERLETRRS